ncbi:hypothetical protein PENTCL1PPCAC_29891, partial [Pristionchus entomophagus]
MIATSSILLVILPIVTYGAGNCNGIVQLGCFEDADCMPATTDGKCVGGDMATLVMGCCGALATTTRTSVLTTTRGSCVDKINPMTGTSGCARNAHLCGLTAYYSVMSDQCPRTCGRCGGSTGSTNSTGTCADQINPTTRRSDCQERRIYCNHTAYASLMKIQCPATCGFC